MASIAFGSRTAAGEPFGQKAAAFVLAMGAGLKEWADARRTNRILSQLSDRQLEDIGVRRDEKGRLHFDNAGSR